MILPLNRFHFRDCVKVVVTTNLGRDSYPANITKWYRQSTWSTCHQFGNPMYSIRNLAPICMSLLGNLRFEPYRLRPTVRSLLDFELLTSSLGGEAGLAQRRGWSIPSWKTDLRLETWGPYQKMLMIIKKLWPVFATTEECLENSILPSSAAGHTHACFHDSTIWSGISNCSKFSSCLFSKPLMGAKVIG